MAHVVDQDTDLALDHLSQLARRARIATVKSIHRSGGGHFGGALSVIDIFVALFQHTRDCPWRNGDRDKIILSKGHAAAGYYAVMAEFGLIERGLLEDLGQVGAVLQGHPDMTSCPAVDFSTGSLGQGLSAALGMAVVLQDARARAWVVLGDGECQEGQVWEAAMVAARLQVANLTAVVDQNGLQEWGYRNAECVQPPIADARRKWEAFGWRVLECRGHDHADLLAALRKAELPATRPTVILANTVKGYGSDLISVQADRFHCDQLSEAELCLVLGQL